MRILLAATALLVLASPASAAQRYRVTFIEAPNGGWSYGRAINNAGTVAGSYDGDDGDAAFFAEVGQAMTTLDTSGAGGVAAVATGINDAGQISGTYSTAGYDAFAYRYDPVTGVETLPQLAGYPTSLGQAINQAGVVAGDTRSQSGPLMYNTHAIGFYQAPGDPAMAVDEFDGPLTFASAINNLGQIAGHGIKDGYNRAYVFTPGSGLTELNPLGRSSSALGINDAGQVALYAFNFALDYRHAFLYTPGSGYFELNVPGFGFETTPYGLNAAGRVVGNYDGYGGYVAFLYDGHATRDLNRATNNLAPGDHLYSAHAINDHGQITGDGLFNGQIVAFRLDPDGFGAVPEPGAWALLIAGFGGIGALRRRKGALQTA